MDNFTEVNARESRDGKMRTVIIRGATAPGKLVGAAISLIVVVGLVHVIDATANLQDYQGPLELGNFFGALVAAIGIYRGNRWGWALGALVAVGAFAGYVISRTVGLPGLPIDDEWLEPLGILSLMVETLFIGLGITTVARYVKEARKVRR